MVLFGITLLNTLMWSVKCHVDNIMTQSKCHIVISQFIQIGKIME
jgi:hypothetical protein